ncbi:MAG: phage tail protein [Lachnospiraceae bacterium]|jgi:tail X family protein|nr:MAG: phage tail protein [Lachnospiraceae bacterium]
MKDRIYIAKSGDTWDSISFKIYEDEFKVKLLMNANKDLMHIFVFGGGERVKIPELHEDVSSSLPDWRK